MMCPPAQPVRRSRIRHKTLVKIDPLEIEHVALASTPRADLYNTSPPYDHGDHGGRADGTVPRTDQFRVAVGAEEIRNGVHRDLVPFRIDRIAAIER